MQKATRTRLAQALGSEPSYLAKIVSRIRKISGEAYLRPYRLHTSLNQRRPSGPPRVYYELNGEHLTTFPETAFLLLELLDYPKEASRRVSFRDFVKSMSSKTRLDESSVSTRVAWAVQNDYVASDGSGTYLASPRTNGFGNAVFTAACRPPRRAVRLLVRFSRYCQFTLMANLKFVPFNGVCYCLASAETIGLPLTYNITPQQAPST